ncbi:MAG: two-component system, OmpR family, sensor kinase, partial [Solirubrobacterales bacterium]|nr:two-component system, OmpR family, sensor kinase [Solirubrobacterales bacterium]
SGREIVVEGAPEIAASVDRFRIEQALGNLVENALRHGGGEIRLSARQDGGRVALEVADRGPGFDAGFAEHAFERFSRGDSGRSGEGAGLGLAIVQAIAAAHDGEAMAMSADGVTVLRISLPAGGVRAASGP